MSETLLPFKFGAFRLAIEAQVPIVPIVFSPYQTIYNVEKRTESFYWRPGSITIRFLDPIETTGMTVEKDLQRLTDLTRARMIDAYENLRHGKTQ